MTMVLEVTLKVCVVALALAGARAAAAALAAAQGVPTKVSLRERRVRVMAVGTVLTRLGVLPLAMAGDSPAACSAYREEARVR